MKDPAQQEPHSTTAFRWWSQHRVARRLAGPSINWNLLYWPCGCINHGYLPAVYESWLSFVRHDEAVASEAMEREGSIIDSFWRAWGTVPAAAD